MCNENNFRRLVPSNNLCSGDEFLKWPLKSMATVLNRAVSEKNARAREACVETLCAFRNKTFLKITQISVRRAIFERNL